MENTTGTIPVVKVLFALYPGMDALNVLGPLEILNKANHNINDNSKFIPVINFSLSHNPHLKIHIPQSIVHTSCLVLRLILTLTDTGAFDCTYASATPTVESEQGVLFKSDASFEEIHKHLKEFDILIIPGGDFETVIKSKAQPLQIIKAFSDVQQKYPDKERTLMAIGTASLLLAHVGTLAGLSATTHPDYYTKFENINTDTSRRDLSERSNLLEERYVVNNLRFDLGEDIDVNPYIRKKSDARRPSNARKGSNSWKESNTRRESNARRAAMLLGGLRVITSGGTGCGMDAALYLVSIMVSVDSANEAARLLQHVWTKGVVVDGVDV
jgi:putative intracellular protease/amidase